MLPGGVSYRRGEDSTGLPGLTWETKAAQLEASNREGRVCLHRQTLTPQAVCHVKLHLPRGGWLPVEKKFFLLTKKSLYPGANLRLSWISLLIRIISK